VLVPERFQDSGRFTNRSCKKSVKFVGTALTPVLFRRAFCYSFSVIDWIGGANAESLLLRARLMQKGNSAVSRRAIFHIRSVTNSAFLVNSPQLYTTQ
jgi:hypothetical protein